MQKSRVAASVGRAGLIRIWVKRVGEGKATKHAHPHYCGLLLGEYDHAHQVSLSKSQLGWVFSF